MLDKTESESLREQGGWLVQQTVMGEVYGITKGSVIAIQLEGKVPLLPRQPDNILHTQDCN